jgi:hypothetical protein
MRLRIVIVLGCLLLFGTAAFAQDYPKVEIQVDYSYMRFNPDATYVSASNLNGGGGGVILYINEYFGIEADFEGYASTTQSVQFPTGSALCPTGCSMSASGNVFTYAAGPIFKYRSEHIEPFFETLFGGAHSNVYTQFIQACAGNCVIPYGNPSNNAFNFIIGGGFDVPVSKRVAIRAGQFDYSLTTFGNGLTKGTHIENNFRIQAGVVFRF